MYYNELLDEDDRLAYSLIELFVKRRTDTISLIDIRDQLQISDHKLAHIVEIVEKLALRLNTFSISKSKKACTLETSPTFSLQDIYREILKTSIGFKLLSELVNNPSFSLESFAERNYLSVRSISRKISGLSDYLNNCHLDMNLRKKVPLLGDEYFIRYFFQLLYWQIDGPDKAYEQLTSGQIQELNQTLINDYPYYRKIDRKRWLHYYDFTLKRIRNGFYAEDLPDEILNYKNVCMNLDDFEKKFIMHAAFPSKMTKNVKDKEIALLYYFFSMITTYSYSESEELSTRLAEKMEQNADLLQPFTKMIYKLFRVVLTDSEKVFLMLNLSVIHSKTHVYATKNKTDIYGRSTSDFELAAYFPAYYYKVKNELLSSTYHGIFQTIYAENERIFFQYCMLLREILENHQSIPFRIFLQSKFGKLQEEWQKRRVIDVISNDICVQFVEEVQQADLVLTDYIEKNNDTKENKYHWQTNPDARDWKYILEFVTQFQADFLQ